MSITFDFDMKSPTSFENVAVGDSFVHKGKCYMKISNKEVATRIKNVGIDYDTIVLPVE